MLPEITPGSLGSSGGRQSERQGKEAPPTPQRCLRGRSQALLLGRSLEPLCVSVSSPAKWLCRCPLGVTWGQGSIKSVGSAARPAWVRNPDPPRWALGQVAQPLLCLSFICCKMGLIEIQCFLPQRITQSGLIKYQPLFPSKETFAPGI